jgi:hypothetical protein
LRPRTAPETIPTELSTFASAFVFFACDWLLNLLAFGVSENGAWHSKKVGRKKVPKKGAWHLMGTACVPNLLAIGRSKKVPGTLRGEFASK